MKDVIGGAWDDLRPHVEDSIRNGDFEMPDININQEDIEYVWGELQAVPSYTARFQAQANEARALARIGAIQQEERETAHRLYVALCEVWLATCGRRDLPSARADLRAEIGEMRAFLDGLELELL